MVKITDILKELAVSSLRVDIVMIGRLYDE
jgi:hypothetical protein